MMQKKSITSNTRGIRAALMVGLVMAAGSAASAQTIVDNSGSARNGKVGYWSSIVAQSGEVGISYYCEDDHANPSPEMYALRFAWRTGSTWQWTSVIPGAGSHTTMRRGTDGLYRIAYDTWDGMGFATGSGTTWDVGTVPVAPGVSPTQMSMALDSHRRPHIAYMNIANGGDHSMRYTYWDGVQWVRDNSEVLSTNIWTPTIGDSNTWLQLDSFDVPHIAFAVPSDTINAWGQIRYATLLNGAWVFEDLGMTGVDPSLAIGHDNQPRMLFNSNAGITYAYKNASGWHFETVAAGESGSGNSLALSDLDQPYATFGMTAFEDQYIARREASGWILTRIDGDGTGSPHEILGRYGNSIDVDESGTPHVSYLNIDIYGLTHRCDLMYYGDAGGPPPCINIIERPVSVTVCGGGGAQFSALGEATVPPTYAWEWQAAGATSWVPVSDGLNFNSQTNESFFASGAFTTTLSLAAGTVAITDNAAFRCVMTSSCGSTATPSAVLTAGRVPAVLTQPHDAQVCGAGTVQFATLADVTAEYHWQWQASGSAPWVDVTEGTNLDPLTSVAAFDAHGSNLPGMQLSSVHLDAGATHRFRCQIIGTCGSAQSNEAMLSGGGLQILDQPRSETLCQGDPAAFFVTTTDSSAIASWEMYEPDLQTWVAIAEGINNHSVLGAFTATGASAFSISMVGFTDDDPNHTRKTGMMNVRCHLVGDCGEVESDAAQLRIIECCPGDFNRDSVLDFFDYLDFVDAFAAGLPSSDFNADSVIDFFDYLDFVDAFSRGC